MVTLVGRRRLRSLDYNLLFKVNFIINKRKYKTTKPRQIFVGVYTFYFRSLRLAHSVYHHGQSQAIEGHDTTRVDQDGIDTHVGVN